MMTTMPRAVFIVMVSAAAAALSAAEIADSPESCQLFFNATTVGVPGTTCWEWDLSKVATHTWLGNTTGCLVNPPFTKNCSRWASG